MKPKYITLVGTTPQVVALDTDVIPFLVDIRLASGVTALGALEWPGDSVAPNTYTPPVTTQTPVYQALPAAVNGVITLTTPYAAIQLTPTTGGVCTILQQGVR